jgi:hypothetical protein
MAVQVKFISHPKEITDRLMMDIQVDGKLLQICIQDGITSVMSGSLIVAEKHAENHVIII